MDHLDQSDLTTGEEEQVNSTYEELRRAMIAEDLRNRPASAQPTLGSSILLITAALMAATQCNEQPLSSVEENPVGYSMTDTSFSE